MANVKNKYRSAEDFIGWKSPDGKLEVISMHEKSREGKPATFKVTCTECSKDPELFPDGYFVSIRTHLENNHKPCGCSSSYKWKEDQCLLRVRRASKEKGFVVLGYAEEYHGKDTRLECECLIDGNKWNPTAHGILSGRGCQTCQYREQGQKTKIPKIKVVEKCNRICDEMNYKFIGFVGGEYIGAQHTYVEYECNKHGTQKAKYTNFVNNGTRCPLCWRERQRDIARSGNGYYPERKDEPDLLYVLNFNSEFIKIGRSFNLKRRLKELQTDSGIKLKNIFKLRIYTATHQEIYDYEQDLLKKLRLRELSHLESYWTNETFVNDCLDVLNEELDSCKFKRLL